MPERLTTTNRVLFDLNPVNDRPEFTTSTTYIEAPEDGGQALSGRMVELMRAAGIPNGLTDLGYDAGDMAALAEGAFAQQRLLAIAPCPVSKEDLANLYVDAMRYW